MNGETRPSCYTEIAAKSIYFSWFSKKDSYCPEENTNDLIYSVEWQMYTDVFID